MLKKAIHLSEQEREGSKELRGTLLTSILDSGVEADEEVATRLIDQALAKWGCANPKMSLNDILGKPTKFKQICDLVYQLSNKGADITESIKKAEVDDGRQVIRVSILPNGKYAAYSTALPSERDDRLVRFDWLVKTTYTNHQKGIKSNKGTYVHIKEFPNDETIQFQVDNLADYVVKDSPFSSPNDKNKKLNAIQGVPFDSKELITLRGDGQATSDLITKFYDVRERISDRRKNGYVPEPSIAIPIGHRIHNGKHALYGFYGCASSYLAWLVAGDEKLTAKLVKLYSMLYANEQSAIRNINRKIETFSGKGLHEVICFATMSDTPKDVFIDDRLIEWSEIRSVPNAAYSIQKRLESLIKRHIPIYCESEEYQDLDDLLGIKQPENFRPLIVLSVGGFADKGYNLFDYTDELFKKHEYAATIFNSLESFKEKCSTYEYTSVGGDLQKERRIVMDLIETKPKKHKGIMADMSFTYKAR